MEMNKLKKNVMKKNYSFYSLLLSIPVGLLVLFAFTNGQPGQFSGSPGDGGNTCTTCHAPGSTYGGVPVLTGVPSSYIPGQSYNLSLSVVGSSRNKFGFNVTAENGTNVKVGTWNAGTGTRLRTDAAGLTHDSSGSNTSTWNFTWTAPATNQGNVTFYFATLQANNNGANSGDQMVAGSVQSTLGTADVTLANFKLYPTTVVDNMTIALQNTDVALLRIYNLSGALVKEQSISAEEQLSLSNLKAGIYLINVTADGASKTERIIKT